MRISHLRRNLRIAWHGEWRSAFCGSDEIVPDESLDLSHKETSYSRFCPEGVTCGDQLASLIFCTEYIPEQKANVTAMPPA
jgi:hypothetical protein